MYTVLAIFLKTVGHTICHHPGSQHPGHRVIQDKHRPLAPSLWELPSACKVELLGNQNLSSIYPSSCLGALMGLGIQEGERESGRVAVKNLSQPGKTF